MPRVSHFMFCANVVEICALLMNGVMEGWSIGDMDYSTIGSSLQLFQAFDLRVLNDEGRAIYRSDFCVLQLHGFGVADRQALAVASTWPLALFARVNGQPQGFSSIL